MKTLVLLIFLFSPLAPVQAESVLKIGSKRFTESYILAEILAQVAESVGEVKVKRRFGLGGTGITYQALKEGEIDVYPEYTGTLLQAVVSDPTIQSTTELDNYFIKNGLRVSPKLGFNNSYGLATNQEVKAKYALTQIEDLKKSPDLKVGLSHEFIERKDGLKALEKYYNMSLTQVIPMEHGLSYDALSRGRIQVNVVYTTDAKIKKYNLHLLEDNRDFFPEYDALLLQDKNLAESYPRTYEAWRKNVFGKIDEEKMRELNMLAEEEGLSFFQVADYFLNGTTYSSGRKGIPWSELGKLSAEHLKLVGVSLIFSVLFGLPIGIMATKRKWLAQLSLAGSGLLQTIPSLALLCFLIPLVGIGQTPAYIALFLYGLLPIVRNTYTGLSQLDQKILESAHMMGLTPWQQLVHVKLPLASPSIMGGIKTSAVINVGTATLAAFIGAGGLGSMIVTGLALNDNHIILQGAIPAALLAVVIHIIFEGLDRIFVPSPLKK